MQLYDEWSVNSTDSKKVLDSLGQIAKYHITVSTRQKLKTLESVSPVIGIIRGVCQKEHKQ